MGARRSPSALRLLEPGGPAFFFLFNFKVAIVPPGIPFTNKTSRETLSN